MTTTGTVTETDLQNQTRLCTVAGMTGASGTSPSYSIGPNNGVTLEIKGTWDSATFVVNASNDGGTTWFQLKNWQNSNMSYTSNSFDIFAQATPLLIQFSWSGGDSSTSITAYLGINKAYF